MIINILSFLIILVLIFTKINIESRKDILSRDDTMAIKGIAALLIFFAHFYNILVVSGVDVGIGRMWLLTGGMGVGLFFFLSGYGLNKSNGIIKPHFLLKRVKGVLMPFAVIKIVLYLIDFLRGQRPSISSVLVSAFSSTWFVSIILIIYIGYYICYELFGREYLDISVLIYNIVIGAVFIVLDFNPRWYNAHLLFSLGMYLADYNERIVDIVSDKKWWIKCGIGMIGFFGCSVLFTYYKGALWANVFKTFAGVCMCFVVFCIMGHCRLNSRALQWLGKNSLLVYLIHISVINILQPTKSGSNIRLLLIIILMTLAGIAIYNFGEYGLKWLLTFNKGRE